METYFLALKEKIDIKRFITLSLSAEDWSLYRRHEAQNIADKLNAEVAQAINSAAQMPEALHVASLVLIKYDDFGANDTEGRDVLESIVRIAFRH